MKIRIVDGLVAVVSTALLVIPSLAPAGESDPPITPEGMAQVEALLQEKESRTPAQRKIDSNLLYEVRMRRGSRIAPGVATLATGLAVDTDGTTAVDIRANVTDALLRQLSALNAAIIDISRPYRTVAARLPLAAVETLAGSSDVIFIQPYFPANFWHDRVTPQSPGARDDRGPSSFAERAERVRAFLDDVIPPPSMPQVGSQNSQGDTTHQANTVRSTIGPGGAGIKIGVLSNGVVSLAASQGLGDLGPVTVLPGQTGTGDEGTAMLEIVHDLAPQAELYFATANPIISAFAQNVRDLRAAGCDIIIDDVFYFVETPFQDGQAPAVVSSTNGGLVIQAVNDVVAAGAMYFSSAGNQGNLDDNTSSCYQGDWTDGGTLVGATGGNVHNFGGGAQSDLIQTGSGNPINLYWADPLGGSANDYDLFVFNNALTAVVASSTNVQSGTQDPFEQVGTGNTTGNRVVVLKKTAAAARFFHITINANGVGQLGTATTGTTKGHSMAAGAFSVAATPAAAPGPFPAAHSGTNVTETFTSDGPRRIFFDADGTAITPGNFSSTGGLLRQKPDITAADRVSVTGVGGFPTTFSGTSAAAPHAGAIAALLKSGLPSPTNAQIRTALTSTAIDIETAGTDRDSGVGIIMPLPALASLGIVAQAALDKGAHTVAELAGSSDGDGAVERLETGTLAIASLVNNGAVAATGVTATLTSTTAGVTILAPASRPYADLATGGGTASNATPYQFQLGTAYTCGSPVDFVLTVAYNDGTARSKVFNFTVTLATGFTVTTTMDATAPPADPRYTATTGTQTNRLFRDGQRSVCSPPKAFPGSSAATNPRFDAYSFVATNSGCNVVTITGGAAAAGAIQTFATVYTGSFNPASIATNYLADAGSSPALGAVNPFSFNATTGQTYVVVVSEVPGTGASPAYTVTVTGASLTTCNFAPVQADLSITKTDGVTTATAGGSVTYTITASNAGPSNATGAAVADTFPASLTATWTCVGAGGGTCTAAGAGNINDAVNLPAGGSVTYTASATLSAAATGTLSNTATVAAPGGVTDPTPGNNSATDSDTIARQADLAITKTDGVTTATAGGSVTYTITASNAGPSNATGAAVADTFPASLTATWTCVGAGGGTCTAAGAGNINDAVNLPAGGSVTYTARATLSAAATGTLSNTATVTASGGVTDPTPGNNSATDSDTIARQADLAITKTDGVAAASPGGSVTYTIVASNAGPSNTTGATVTDTFPASLTATWTCVGAGGGTCTAAGAGNISQAVNLPAGGTVTYTVSATVSAAATGTLSNTATVAAPGGVTDPTPGNNTATDTDTLGALADLAVTKTDGHTFYYPGQSLEYTVVVTNAGPSAVTGAVVADTLPADLESASWTCTASAGSACGAPSGAGDVSALVDLLSGGSATFTLTATASPAALGSLSNTVTVTVPVGLADPDPANNSATDTDTRRGGSYHTLSPCRVLDTRNPTGPYGAPPLSASASRTFAIAGRCGVPSNATAVSINLTVTGSTADGFLLAHPTGSGVPTVSTINYAAGQTRANNAAVVLSAGGQIDLTCGQAVGTVEAILDVSGYFVE